jgi:leucyl aminopeptidase
MIPTSTKTTISVSERPPANWQAVVIFVTQGAKPADGAAAAAVAGVAAGTAAARLIHAQAVTGKAKEVVFDLLDKGRVYVVGLGKQEKLTTEIIRQSAASVARKLPKHKISHASVVLPAVANISPEAAAEAVVTGFLLSGFDFQECKGTAKKEVENDKPLPLDVTIIAGNKKGDVEKAVHVARVVADAQNFARTIANRPGNEINPPSLAKIARTMAAEVHLKCTVFDEKQLAQMKMGGLLAVGQGSIQTPPRLIVLEHGQKQRGKPPLLLVGKAITFDTGGISIKPADKMGKMIYDKCGGLAVLGLMYAVAKLKLPIHVVGILSSAENAVSSRAYRPGDILRMYNGVTVEVTNTDAEGRLVLGDALAWGIEKYSPTAVVNLATLTGGVVVALGKHMAGVFSYHDSLIGELSTAAEKAGEKIWRLPLGEDQREQIKSDLADIVNSAGREGHPLQGAAFLSYFVPESLPWAHLDIAGVSDTDKDMPYYGKGATGWGVRTLVNWVMARLASA